MIGQPATPLGIGTALHQLHDDLEADNITGAGTKSLLSSRTGRHRTVSEARTFVYSSFGDNSTSEAAARSNASSSKGPRRVSTTSNFNKDLRDFCTGQPPRQSFLASGERTPPRFRTARRSTLADKPELDSLLKAVMVTYKGEEFLPLEESTIRRLSQWLNGAKPLANHCLFRCLMITSDANKVDAEHLVTALEHIGMYCEHLVIVAPFHTTEFGSIFAREIANLESGSDWVQILRCFPNLQALAFEHPADEPTNLTRDTFYALACALADDSILQKIRDLKLDVPPQIFFDHHVDFHNRQRQRQRREVSPHTFTPLTLVGTDMIYADGAEDFGQLDDAPVLGKIDAFDNIDG